ncbi:HBS1-like protein [Chamberlinius hualienensis]
MSRHRNIRRMNYDDEDDDYDDLYGRSVEDDFCVSPSVAEFMYDRNAQQNPIAAFIRQDNIPEEETSWDDTEIDTSLNDQMRRYSTELPKLGDMDEARLRSCLEEIRNIVGDTIPEKTLIEAVINHSFDMEKALNAILTSAPLETPKPQRERKEKRGNDVIGSNTEGANAINDHLLHLNESEYLNPSEAKDSIVHNSHSFTSVSHPDLAETPAVFKSSTLTKRILAAEEKNMFSSDKEGVNILKKQLLDLNESENLKVSQVKDNVCTSDKEGINILKKQLLHLNESENLKASQDKGNVCTNDNLVQNSKLFASASQQSLIEKPAIFKPSIFTKSILATAEKNVFSVDLKLDQGVIGNSSNILKKSLNFSKPFTCQVHNSNSQAKSKLSQLASVHLNSRSAISSSKPSLFSFALNKNADVDASSTAKVDEKLQQTLGTSKLSVFGNKQKEVSKLDLNTAFVVKNKQKQLDESLKTSDALLSNQQKFYSSLLKTLHPEIDDSKLKLLRYLKSEPSLFSLVLCTNVNKTRRTTVPYQQVFSSKNAINVFDFVTPSPDAIVLEMNKKAFGPMRDSSRVSHFHIKEQTGVSNGDETKISGSIAAFNIPPSKKVATCDLKVSENATSSSNAKAESSKPVTTSSIVKEVEQCKDETVQVENGTVVSTPVKPPSRGRDASSKVDPTAEYKKLRGGGKDLLNLVVIGHVDAGKSTLMGHLLCMVGAVSQKVLYKYEQESKKIGKASFMYAWVLDETGEERSRGVTMDVGYSKFETATKTITLLDAPGHKDFIPNMITGAAQADVAVLVVDSTRGEFETGFETGGQTREHALLVRSLGVSQLVVAINKLDNVNWSEDRYKEIVNTLKHFLLKQAGFKDSDVTYIPCSGLTGENLVSPPTEELLKQWYTGSTLLEQIDKFNPPERPVTMPLRLCVSDVFKGQGSTFSVAGKVETGYVQTGDKVLLMPVGYAATVRGISMDDVPQTNAFAGDQVVLSLSGVDITNVTVGCVVCDTSQPIKAATRFRARIVVFNIDTPITRGYQAVLHYQCLSEPVVVKKLISQLHKGTGEALKNNPRCLTKQTNALVELEVSRPICVEEYKDFKELGRFMLRSKGATLAAGVVTQIL